MGESESNLEEVERAGSLGLRRFGTALARVTRMKRRIGAAVFLMADLVLAGALIAETVAVRNAEGLVRGFLVLRSLEGTILAGADNIQTSQGDRVTTRLIYRFKDGSLRDETAVFTQRGRFRLLSDHVIQRGPSFPYPMEVWIDAVAGRVTVRYREKDGKEITLDEQMALPVDVSNGMVLTLLKNLAPDISSTELSMVVATPKPRLVKLAIRRVGNERFSVGNVSYDATRFDVHVELGGLAGIIAPLIGKQPHDSSAWILDGTAPGFVKSEGPMYAGGPVWRTELASPAWPR